MRTLREDVPGTACNLLSDSIFSCRDVHGKSSNSPLPELFARLMSDDIESLVGLRPHQKQAIHCFLVQAGALALLAAGETKPPPNAERWRELLRGLTPDFAHDEPWCLVVEDLSKPAFMQPPVPEGRWGVFDDDKSATAPDLIDIFPPGRRHDQKAGRAIYANLDHWVYALISLQTGTQQHGPPNKACSRASDGNNFRPFMGLAPPGNWGAHVRRDIHQLLTLRAGLAERYPGYATTADKSLLWIEPWDGNTQIERDAIDIYYVEIARRIRLSVRDGRMSAHRAGSAVARVRQPSRAVGDPWIAVRSDGDNLRPHTVYQEGFGFRTIVKLIGGGEYNAAPLQLLGPSEDADGAMLVFASAGTTRGQKGALGGYHERRIPVPARAAPFFLRKAPAPRLGELARSRVEDVATTANRALRPALFALFQSAPEKPDFSDPKAKVKAEVHIAAFERVVDDSFFRFLFDELAAEPLETDAHRRAWIEFLRDRARDVLATAETGSPLSHVRRYRAQAAAERVLEGAMHKLFSDQLSKNLEASA